MGTPGSLHDMDTDDLTPMAYDTLTQSYSACDVLRAEIGASAAGFKTEDDFLRGTVEFLEEILEDPEGYLDSWALLDELDTALFVERVRAVQAHVAATLKTPRPQRGKPPFEK